MNKWNTIKSLIENKDFEGLQDILHDEYLYLRETTLISKDEMVSFIKKRFEDGLTFEKLELIIENKDLLAWRDILIEHGGKKWETFGGKNSVTDPSPPSRRPKGICVG